MVPTATLNLWNDLFTPLPQTQAQPSENKVFFDHVAAFVDTSSGAWDCFRVISCAMSHLEHLPGLSGKRLMNRINTFIDTAGIGLSIPQMISDVNSLRRSIVHFFSSQELPYSDPLRTRHIVQAAKKSVLDSLNLTNTVSQAALFIERAKIIAFSSKELHFINNVFNGTTAIVDTAEIIGEVYKLKHYFGSESELRTERERTQLEEKKVHSWINIAKSVASVAGAVIALAGITLGVAVEGAAILATIGLACGTVWLGAKIASHFYEKIVIAAHTAPVTRPIIV